MMTMFLIKCFHRSVLTLLVPGIVLIISLPASAVSLHRHIILEGKNLTLGDVFDGAGKYADRIIARAPAPGKRATLTPEWLAYVARSYNCLLYTSDAADE